MQPRTAAQHASAYKPWQEKLVSRSSEGPTRAAGARCQERGSRPDRNHRKPSSSPCSPSYPHTHPLYSFSHMRKIKNQRRNIDKQAMMTRIPSIYKTHTEQARIIPHPILARSNTGVGNESLYREGVRVLVPPFWARAERTRVGRSVEVLGSSAGKPRACATGGMKYSRGRGREF
ncbi:hypothetical protein VTI28DRAFT_3858 [Corynascus sepedonium]